jgi:hypothetical protein
VQPKAVMFPTDAKLLNRARERLVRLAAHTVLSGFVALLLAIIGSVWWVTTSTVGDIRHDVGEIRRGLADNVKATNDVNLALTKEIAGLRVDLAGLAPRIEGLNTTIGKLEIQLASLQNPLSDPKTAVIFVENLKKAGVLVVPQPQPPILPLPEPPKQ